MIPVQIPSCGFSLQSLAVADSPSQALLGEGGQFYLGHVQPGAMLRGMMKFQFLPYPSSLCWLERFIQRRYIVRVQIVTYKDNLLHIGKVLIHKLFDLLCPVRLASVFPDGYSSPAFKWSREHEATAGAVADVFVIDLLRMDYPRTGGSFHENRSEVLSAARPCIREVGEGSAAWSTPPEHPPCMPQTRRFVQEECTTSFSGEAYTDFFSMRPTCTYEMEGRTSNSMARSDMSCPFTSAAFCLLPHRRGAARWRVGSPLPLLYRCGRPFQGMSVTPGSVLFSVSCTLPYSKIS